MDRRLIRVRIYSPRYRADGSEAVSAVIVYATTGSARIAFAEIEARAFERCYVKRLRRARPLTARLVGVRQRAVPGFRAPADSTATRYILQLTRRGAYYFQIEDVFYVRAGRFLTALVLTTADAFPSVAKEAVVVKKLRDRMRANAG